MRKILERDIKKRPGYKETDLRWVEPALEFGREMNVTDPRKLTAYCLCGKDRLLVPDCNGTKFQDRLAPNTVI